VFWVEPDRLTLAVSTLVQRRNSNRPSRIMGEKDSAQRPIFTCKSATEELGEKAMLPRDALGAKYVAMESLIDASLGVNQDGEPQSRPVAWLDRLNQRAVFERQTHAYQRAVIASDAPGTQGMSH